MRTFNLSLTGHFSLMFDEVRLTLTVVNLDQPTDPGPQESTVSLLCRKNGFWYEGSETVCLTKSLCVGRGDLTEVRLLWFRIN